MLGLHLDLTRRSRAARKAARDEVWFFKSNYGAEAPARLKARLAEPGLRSEYRKMLKQAARGLLRRS